MKLKVGLYGVVFHAVILALFFSARSSGDANPPLYYRIAAPLVLASAFIVYFFFLLSHVWSICWSSGILPGWRAGSS